MSSQRLLFPEAAVTAVAPGRQGGTGTARQAAPRPARQATALPPRRRLVRVPAGASARALRVASRRAPPPVVEPVAPGPMVDHVTEAALEALFSPEALAEGRAAVAAGLVLRPLLRGAHADALVEGADRQRHHVRLGWSVLGLGAACSCGVGRCAHGAALGLFLLEGTLVQGAGAPASLGVAGTAGPVAATAPSAITPLKRAAPRQATPVAPSARPGARPAQVVLAELAERKRSAALALAAAGQGAEALPLFHAALELACRSLDPRGDPGEAPAALLAAVHAYLVPAGLLAPGEAAALARAGEVARAFEGSALPPPEPLVAAVAEDVSGLVGRLSSRAWKQTSDIAE